jgi:uncharacterized protein (DUF2236 family)
VDAAGLADTAGLADDTAGRHHTADAGLFGPESVTWRLHGDAGALVGGLRALLLQALEPRAMRALVDHSDYRREPLRRLGRTLQYVAVTTFGTTAEAEAAARRVRQLHEQVNGIDPVTGQRYSATDQELLRYVHLSLVDSMLAAAARFGPRLRPEEQDRYVVEMHAAARLVGLSTEGLPDRAALVRAAVAAHPIQVATPEATDGLLLLATMPVPLVARLPWTLAVAAAVDLLPDFARRAYRLPPTWPLAPAIRPTTAILLEAARRLLGPSPAARAARERLAA